MTTSKMRVRIVSEACRPVRMHATDAGLDLVARRAYTIKPGESRMIDTGCAVGIPKGCVGLLTPRSSLFRNHGLMLTNSPGIIDEGYTANIGAELVSMSSHVEHIDAGERILQLVIVAIRRPDVEVVEELADSERGEGGFGSTGR